MALLNEVEDEVKKNSENKVCYMLCKKHFDAHPDRVSGGDFICRLTFDVLGEDFIIPKTYDRFNNFCPLINPVKKKRVEHANKIETLEFNYNALHGSLERLKDKVYLKKK